MKRKSKRCTGIVLSVVLFVVSFGMCGCGGNAVQSGAIYDNGNLSEKSEHSTSGTAISGGQQSKTRGRYCSDTNLYLEAMSSQMAMPSQKASVEENTSDQEDSEFEITESVLCLAQTRLDGSCRKEIDLGKGFSGLLGVSDSWIYYEMQEGEQGQHVPVLGIYRVPIQKGADGYDVVDTTNVEKIIGSESGNVNDYEMFVDDSYLVYGRECGESSTEIVVYDLQKREEVDFGKNKIIIDGEGGVILGIWRQMLAQAALGEQYAVLTEEKLYVISPASASWKDVLEDEYIKGYGVYNDRFLFYNCMPAEEEKKGYKQGPDDMDKDIIRVCDGEKDRGLVTRTELKQAVESAAESVEHMSADELGDWEMSNLFCDGDRCYIEVQITGMHDGIYRMGYLVLSKAAGEEKIRVEEKLTKSMRELDKEWVGRWYVEGKKKKKVIQEHSIVNPVHCDDIVNGKVYFYFHGKQNERHLAYYDMGTGEAVEITRQSPAYFERFYEEMHQVAFGYFSDETDENFGYQDEADILDMTVLPEEGAYFEETKSK